MKKVKLLGISLLAVATVFIACEKNITNIGENPEITKKDVNAVLGNCIKPEGFLNIGIPEEYQPSMLEEHQYVAYCEGQTIVTNHSDLGEVEVEIYMEFNTFGEILTLAFNANALGVTAERYEESGICCGDNFPGANFLSECISDCNENIDHEEGNRKGVRRWRWCKAGCWAVASATVAVSLLK
jgi:hypothetical protein